MKRTKGRLRDLDQMIITGAPNTSAMKLLVRLQARAARRLPSLVLGDGGVDLGILD